MATKAVYLSTEERSIVTKQWLLEKNSLVPFVPPIDLRYIGYREHDQDFGSIIQVYWVLKYCEEKHYGYEFG